MNKKEKSEFGKSTEQYKKSNQETVDKTLSRIEKLLELPSEMLGKKDRVERLRKFFP